MKESELIPIQHLCEVYQIDTYFFEDLYEHQVIEIRISREEKHIPAQQLHRVERIIRLHKDLDVNIAGIDVIMNLLERIEALESELDDVRNNLKIYRKLG